jgi:flagellar hook assembly protein FlgD
VALVAFASSPLRARAGRKLTVRYILTDSAKITLSVKPKGKAATIVARKSGKLGLGSIAWNGKLKGKAVKRGSYTLIVTATRDGKSVASSIKVSVR